MCKVQAEKQKERLRVGIGVGYCVIRHIGRDFGWAPGWGECSLAAFFLFLVLWDLLSMELRNPESSGEKGQERESCGLRE